MLPWTFACTYLFEIVFFSHPLNICPEMEFMDGSSITVKRKQGEKDCIETAIAYCLLKQCLTPADIKKLVTEREEH